MEYDITITRRRADAAISYRALEWCCTHARSISIIKSSSVSSDLSLLPLCTRLNEFNAGIDYCSFLSIYMCSSNNTIILSPSIANDIDFLELACTDGLNMHIRHCSTVTSLLSYTNGLDVGAIVSPGINPHFRCSEYFLQHYFLNYNNITRTSGGHIFDKAKMKGNSLPCHLSDLSYTERCVYTQDYQKALEDYGKADNITF